MFKQKTSMKVNTFVNLAAPVRGFDASSPLPMMKPGSAVILENYLAKPDGLITRDGYTTHITAIPLQVDRLLVYAAPSGGESIWGCTAGGIYNLTAAGVCPAASIVLTDGKLVGTAIATGAGNYLMAVNGVDTLKLYDGAAWSSVALLGATSTVIYSYIETYRQRIYLAKRNSLEIEYLPANAIAGAPTNYPLGALFRLGGKIIALSVWTVDGGIGPEDNLCVMTNKGEVAVFAGSDPATWSLRGVYFAGEPLGLTPMFKYGGDVLLLTVSGVIPMTSLIQTASIDRTITVTSQIRPYLVAAASAYSSLQGWQIISDPIKPYLMVNIPSTPVRMQAVMESQSGAWSTYTGWNAIHWCRAGNQMYFSDSTGSAGAWTVKRVTGFADDGANITATILQAYNSFGYGGNKKIEEIRPYFEADGNFTYNAGVSSDFQDAREYTQVAVGASVSAGIWGSSLWGAALWSGSANVSNDFVGIPDIYAMWKGLYIQTVSRLGAVRYLGADILLNKGGHF